MNYKIWAFRVVGTRRKEEIFLRLTSANAWIEALLMKTSLICLVKDNFTIFLILFRTIVRC